MLPRSAVPDLWLERLFRQEGLGFERAVALLDEHLHLALGGVEFLFAGGGEAYAFLEELERVFEGQVALFQLIDDGFELLERFFK